MAMIQKRLLVFKRFYLILPVFILSGVLLSYSVVVSGQAGGIKPRVFVYVNTTMKTRVMQKQLQSAMPEVAVTVFSRSRDFKKSVSEESPEAVISRKVVVQSVKMKPGLQGKKGGKDTEPYSLVSVDKPVDAASLAGKNVGLVDELGRRETGAFLTKSLGVKPLIKRTVKTEDLLALLQFAAAEAVFLPKRLVPVLKKSSQLNLIETPLPNARMSLPAVGFASDAAKQTIIPSIKKISISLNERMGVESWQ